MGNVRCQDTEFDERPTEKLADYATLNPRFAPFDPAEGARGFGHICFVGLRQGEACGAIGIDHGPRQVASAADAFPDWLDPALPFLDAGVGRGAVFKEQRLAAGAQHAAHFGQGLRLAFNRA
jgi:hypothetical protein